MKVSYLNTSGLELLCDVQKLRLASYGYTNEIVVVELYNNLGQSVDGASLSQDDGITDTQAFARFAQFIAECTTPYSMGTLIMHRRGEMVHTIEFTKE